MGKKKDKKKKDKKKKDKKKKDKKQKSKKDKKQKTKKPKQSKRDKVIADCIRQLNETKNRPKGDIRDRLYYLSACGEWIMKRIYRKDETEDVVLCQTKNLPEQLDEQLRRISKVKR